MASNSFLAPQARAQAGKPERAKRSAAQQSALRSFFRPSPRYTAQTPLLAVPFLAQTHMLTGEIRSQIDQIWNAFWSGGISNPLEVIEQITYLLFLKRLDEQEIAEELKANREKKPMQKRFFPEGKDSKKRSFHDYRWNRFKNTD